MDLFRKILKKKGQNFRNWICLRKEGENLPNLWFPKGGKLQRKKDVLKKERKKIKNKEK